MEALKILVTPPCSWIANLGFLSFSTANITKSRGVATPGWVGPHACTLRFSWAMCVMAAIFLSARTPIRLLGPLRSSVAASGIVGRRIIALLTCSLEIQAYWFYFLYVLIRILNCYVFLITLVLIL